MALRVDNAGRIVIPKAVRERFGLRAGSELELSEFADGLVLKTVGPRPKLVDRGGLLVHLGRLPEGYNWTALVQEDRHQRMRSSGGEPAD